MDDEPPLPEPTPEVLQTLKAAEDAASDDDSRAQFRRLREALSGPTLPTARQIEALLKQGSSVPTKEVFLADEAVGHDGLTTVTVSRSTSWDTLAAVSSSRSTNWNVEAAAQKAVDYAVEIATWGGAALVVAKVIHEASDTVLSWWIASGR
jgi:hypothetical protein